MSYTPDYAERYIPPQLAELQREYRQYCAKFEKMRRAERRELRSSPLLATATRMNVMSHLPPVPPENRSDKGPGSEPKASAQDHVPDRRTRNLHEQGRQGNIKQNTTNQGYQQDR
jgi:hypothetical protein